MQTDLQEVRLEEESTWQAMALLTKGGRDYYDIGLVEVVCKVVMVILNLCLNTSIDFHNVLNGFLVRLRHWDHLP